MALPKWLQDNPHLRCAVCDMRTPLPPTARSLTDFMCPDCQRLADAMIDRAIRVTGNAPTVGRCIKYLRALMSKGSY